MAEEQSNKVEQTDPEGRYNRYSKCIRESQNWKLFQALDTLEGREVLWNTIKLSDTHTKETIEREAKRLQSFSEHPLILPVYKWWFNDDELCFVAEHAPKTLRKQIAMQHPMSTKLIKKYCRQILEALEFLHSKSPPVVHRQLSCVNISVMATTGDLLIGGLVPTDALGNTDWLPGHDVFSFGVCVYEMATNEPVSGSGLKMLEMCEKGGGPGPLEAIKDTNLRGLVQMCLSADKRPAVHDLIKLFVSDESPPESPPQTTHQMSFAAPKNGGPEPPEGACVVAEVSVKETASVDKVSITMKINFPIAAPAGGWTTNRKIKAFNSIYVHGQDNAWEFASELISNVMQANPCNNIEELKSDLVTQLKSKVAASYQVFRESKNAPEHQKIVDLLMNQLDFKPELADKFVNEDITVDDLPLLKAEELESLVDKLGPRRRLQQYIDEQLAKKKDGDENEEGEGDDSNVEYSSNARRESSKFEHSHSAEPYGSGQYGSGQYGSGQYGSGSGEDFENSMRRQEDIEETEETEEAEAEAAIQQQGKTKSVSHLKVDVGGKKPRRRSATMGEEGESGARAVSIALGGSSSDGEDAREENARRHSMTCGSKRTSLTFPPPAGPAGPNGHPQQPPHPSPLQSPAMLLLNKQPAPKNSENFFENTSEAMLKMMGDSVQGLNNKAGQ